MVQSSEIFLSSSVDDVKKDSLVFIIFLKFRLFISPPKLSWTRFFNLSASDKNLDGGGEREGIDILYCN